MHIDNFEPDTFTWILQDLDLPYIPEEWDVLRNKAYAKDPYKMNGMSVIGKYISKMKLKQWKDYGWEDSARICAEHEQKRSEAIAQQKRYEEELKNQYENGEISENQYKTLMSIEAQHKEEMAATPNRDAIAHDGFYNEENYMTEDELVDPAADLTKDDKMFLALKWGRLYKPSEWIELEKSYNDMMQSFDIQDADTINTLKLICKTNLKLNQAIDCGDVEGYQKLSRVYDSLRKSAKFTAAQNKEQKSEFVDCVGNMVAYCEKNGGQIPKYEIKVDQDIVDTVIKDLKAYTKSLIYEDKSLAKQIEDYLKKREISEQQKKDREEAASRNEEVTVSDEDIAYNLERIANEREIDQDEYYDESDGEEE
jgi:hypothetical protein